MLTVCLISRKARLLVSNYMLFNGEGDLLSYRQNSKVLLNG